jgi:hypothetical protein
MDIRIIIRLDCLIRIQGTGKPNDLSVKLGISNRRLYEYIAFMKCELNAPIIYERYKQTYRYEKECNFCFDGKR